MATAAKQIKSMPVMEESAGRSLSDRIESVRLSRSRLVEQMTHATHPAYRSMLERALRDLDAQMTELRAQPETERSGRR